MLLEIQHRSDVLQLHLLGAWCIENTVDIEAALGGVPEERALRVVCTKLARIDLSGAWLLYRWIESRRKRACSVEFEGPAPAHFAFIEDMLVHEQLPVPADTEGWFTLKDLSAWIGRRAVLQGRQTADAIAFFGRTATDMAAALGSVLRGTPTLSDESRPRLRRTHRLRLASVTRHIYETGIQAVPIVSLIAFLISVIVAYLGAQQLQQFGAEIFTVDLVAIAVLREMGPLLTAVIVAGRSGSAFAAEIGVMRLNDEIDALQSMGINYFEALVLPRLVGLLIALPLLTIIADAMGLMGGALLSSQLLDISLSQFVPRVQEALSPTTFWAGLVKAPVFALLIALVGTYRGMQVRDSSRELGRLTTVAVVQSIFLVIFADAVFAVIFVELDF